MGDDRSEDSEQLSTARRHTVAARPSKQRTPKTSLTSPQADDFNRPKLSPPTVMGDSLYSTVEKKTDKNQRYPAPNIPAPPPPYEGSAMKDAAASRKMAADQPARTVSPPGYEPVTGLGTASITGAAKTPRDMPRPPPSRPSHPPAGMSRIRCKSYKKCLQQSHNQGRGNAINQGEVSETIRGLVYVFFSVNNPPPGKDSQSFRGRSATAGSVSSAAARAKNRKTKM